MSVGLKGNADGSGAIQVGGTDAVTLSTALDTTLAGSLNAPNTFAFKNRIINGDMRIDQRNAGASVTPVVGQQYLVDRFSYLSTQASKVTAQQNQGSVTPPVGFTKYLGFTSSSAYSVLSTDYFFLNQAIEGFNVADLAWGTASAATITLSFWVRSSLTGTFGGALCNGAGNRSYPFTYTINSANTWEKETITIAGDTTGTWATDNTQGLYLFISLGAGTSVSGTAGAWSGTVYRSATGATSVVGTNGATFYITGVQLEKGRLATSFDYRPYGTELQLCQRYYRIRTATAGGYIVGTTGQCTATTAAYVNNIMDTTGMRTAPTATFSAANTFQLTAANATPIAATAITAQSFYQDSPISAYVTVASGLVAGNATTLLSSAGSAAVIQASAEL